MYFLAVQDSLIGDLVTQWGSEWVSHLLVSLEQCRAVVEIVEYGLVENEQNVWLDWTVMTIRAPAALKIDQFHVGSLNWRGSEQEAQKLKIPQWIFIKSISRFISDLMEFLTFD